MVVGLKMQRGYPSKSRSIASPMQCEAIAPGPGGIAGLHLEIWRIPTSHWGYGGVGEEALWWSG